MLLGLVGVFLTLGMVISAVSIGRAAVGFGGVIVMFSCFIMLVSSHWFLRLVLREPESNRGWLHLVPRLNELFSR